MYLSKNDFCDVTLSLYTHRASSKIWLTMVVVGEAGVVVQGDLLEIQESHLDDGR